MQRRNLFRLAAAGCAALSVPTLRAAQSKSIVIIYSRTGSTEQLAALDRRRNEERLFEA